MIKKSSKYKIERKSIDRSQSVAFLSTAKIIIQKSFLYLLLDFKGDQIKLQFIMKHTVPKTCRLLERQSHKTESIHFLHRYSDLEINDNGDHTSIFTTPM